MAKAKTPAPSPRKQPATPKTKEEALQQMVQDDPEKMAQFLREILKNK